VDLPGGRMGKPKDKLEIEVMRLPPEDRAELAHRLIESLEGAEVGDYEAEWVQEAASDLPRRPGREGIDIRTRESVDN